jgi:tetratricopeptide (TPR) repeat protein
MKRRVVVLVLFILLPIDLVQLGALLGADLSLAQCAKDDVSKQCTSNGNSEDELSVKEAEKIYLIYNEDFNNLNRAIDKLNKILERNPNNVEAMTLLSRVWLTYGDVIAKDKDEKLKAYEKGRDIAKKAIELSPKNPDAHFWYTANMGRWGQTKGVLKSLFLVPRIKEQLNLILALDPKYVPALDVYGVLYYEIPGFLGGDLKLSEKYLRQAIELDPHLTAIRVDLARVLVKRKRYEEARGELNRVLEEKEPRLYADWYVKDRKDAAELIDKIKGK